MDIYEMVESGELPVPECAKTLGFELISYSREKMEMKARFYARKSSLNPAGAIQGGFLYAMLDDVMGPALVFSLNVGQFAPTLELKTQFFRPAKVGPIEGVGRVVSKGETVCFLEGELFQREQLIAKASATALIKRKLL
ncbi:phenylacetic acid degradation protein [Microbulbifer sp. A4B17]|uniref:PaaI family thioesterase n=1 Tax=Microbulbifer sp. A4B17 TaxID=359370 RepID=UPI000D52DE92|nr:PaaI family thioesterase [Microbulbifer sp. A4B17]AWF80325.1 phenylacetic acid degradation protein [Microbulbifer sp. A4B17]